jgi:hypothetical protein
MDGRMFTLHASIIVWSLQAHKVICFGLKVMGGWQGDAASA